MFLVVQMPRKTVGPVSDINWGRKRTTGGAGIGTTGVFRELVEIVDSISHLASLSSSRLGCDSPRFHSETT